MLWRIAALTECISPHARGSPADSYSWSLYKLAHPGVADLTGITPTTGVLPDLSTSFQIAAAPGL